MSLYLLFSRPDGHLFELRSMYLPVVVLDREHGMVERCCLRLGGSFRLRPSIVRSDRRGRVH